MLLLSVQQFPQEINVVWSCSVLLLKCFNLNEILWNNCLWLLNSKYLKFVDACNTIFDQLPVVYAFKRNYLWLNLFSSYLKLHLSFPLCEFVEKNAVFYASWVINFCPCTLWNKLAWTEWIEQRGAVDIIWRETLINATFFILVIVLIKKGCNFKLVSIFRALKLQKKKSIFRATKRFLKSFVHKFIIYFYLTINYRKIKVLYTIDDIHNFFQLRKAAVRLLKSPFKNI